MSRPLQVLRIADQLEIRTFLENLFKSQSIFENEIFLISPVRWRIRYSLFTLSAAHVGRNGDLTGKSSAKCAPAEK